MKEPRLVIPKPEGFVRFGRNGLHVRCASCPLAPATSALCAKVETREEKRRIGAKEAKTTGWDSFCGRGLVKATQGGEGRQQGLISINAFLCVPSSKVTPSKVMPAFSLLPQLSAIYWLLSALAVSCKLSARHSPCTFRILFTSVNCSLQ
jgi:hypothetical protein